MSEQLPRLKAHFRPQAWINDYAVDIDGGFDFDCTEALLNTDAETIRRFKFHDYDTDNLYHESDVDKEHDGPFEVDVDEYEFREFFEKLGLNHETVTEAELEKARARYTD